MSRVDCEKCTAVFDATRTPVCPDCLVAAWLGSKNFVRPKHDPRRLPLAWESYRSVLSPSLAADPRPHLEFAARSGRWYRDTYYEMFVHMTYEPIGLSPGAGIPEGKISPEHNLDSLLIAEANNPIEAHGFAVSREQFEAQVRAEEFIALPVCEADECDNLCVPGETRCTLHIRIDPSP